MRPYDRNPHFLGRDDLLNDLRYKLQETKPKQYNHRIAIYGMGGVGKTQVAIEYVYRYEQDYNDIYWINASDQAVLLSGFQAIGAKTGCVSAVTECLKPTEVAQAVLSWLRQQDNWLLVVDNLDDVSVADNFLPAMNKGGHTLITTRNPDAKRIPAEGIQIPVLSENDAIELLRIRSEIDVVDFSSQRSTITEIVNELGCLALAIEQAAAFIRSLKHIAEFLPIYQNSRKRLLKRKPPNQHSYPHSVATTILLSFKKVREMENGLQAAKLLHLLAFLNPDEILIDFLQAGSYGLSDELREIIDDKVTFYEALELLQQFSLISRPQKKDSIVIHRLVQAVMKDELSYTEMNMYLDEVIGICKAAFPESWVTIEKRGLCRKFLSQVVEPVFEAANIPSRDAGIALLRIGWFLSDDGKLKDGERLNTRSRDILTDLFGTDHPDTLMSMNNLASTYKKQGKRQETVDLEERVLEARRRTLGEEHSDTLTSMGNLALTYRYQGKLQEAADMGERVLKAMRRTLGEEHFYTLRNMGILASTYRHQGKLQEAADLEERVLEARRETLGEEHPDTLTSMGNLATTYWNQGKLQKAAELGKRVLDGRRKTLGEEHFYTLMSMDNLASTYRDQGKLQEAASLGERVLEARRRILGEDHHHILTSMDNLASTYRNQGKLQEAADLGERVLRVRKKTLGKEHPSTLTSMDHLASTYRHQGKLQEAADLGERALEGRSKTLGEDHPHTLMSIGNLASTYLDQGKLQEAADLKERILEAKRRTLGEAHLPQPRE